MLILEDGTGLLNSNTYVSFEAASAYNLAREPNQALWSAAIDLEAVLIEARQALDGMYTWRGTPLTTTQALNWPRSFVYDDNGKLIPNDAVPALVADAQSQMAYRLLEERATVLPAGMLGPRGASSERIGDWSATYREFKLNDWPEIGRMLRGLTASGPSARGFGQVKVQRWS